MKWDQDYSTCAFPPSTLLPDRILNFLSSNAHVRTTEDLKTLVPEWLYAKRYGQEVLKVIARAETQYLEQIGRKRQNTAEQKFSEEQARRTNKRNMQLVKMVQENRPLPLQTTHAISFASYAGPEVGFVRADPLIVPISANTVSGFTTGADLALKHTQYDGFSQSLPTAASTSSALSSVSSSSSENTFSSTSTSLTGPGSHNTYYQASTQHYLYVPSQIPTLIPPQISPPLLIPPQDEIKLQWNHRYQRKR
jgi:hypothetical protein